MRKLLRVAFVSLCAAAILTGGIISNAHAETIIKPKAENFVFLLDNSGSMGFQHEKANMRKAEAARAVLTAINQDLPEIRANFGVYTFGPYKEYLKTSAYKSSAVGEAINAIPTDFDIFGRMTPMGSGLKSLEAPLLALRNRIAVVTVLDGESNLGPHPRGIIEDMYGRYRDRICFHFISLAQTPAEKAFVADLAGINACSVVADAGDLMQDAYRADFIERVFYTKHTKAVAPTPEVVAPAPEEEVIVFSNINFDFDSAVIKAEYREILSEAAQIIKRAPGTTVLVGGHTCNIGPAQYNMGLSERRAKAVADFLAQEGVSRDHLEVKGYGLTMPTFNNETREGRALNRRVELNLK